MDTFLYLAVGINLLISYDIHEDIMTVEMRCYIPRCLFTDNEALKKCCN